MKKALIISVIAFVASAIAFGVSVAATGVTQGTFSVGIGNFISNAESPNRQEFIFDESFSDIIINSGMADVKVTAADVNEATVKYNSGSGLMTVDAYIRNDKLIVETNEFGFIFGLFFVDDCVLKVTVPDKKYKNVDFSIGSGYSNMYNLKSESFKAGIASGTAELDIFADDIDVDVASGSVTLKNCTGEKAKKIKLECASGDHTLKGFETEKFEFSVASGDINATGISGKGEVSIASGDISLEYKVWDSDLSVDAMSGDVDIDLPENSGVKIDLDAASGGVLVMLEDDGASEFSGDTNSGILGGSNVHNINIDLASGDVNIHN